MLDSRPALTAEPAPPDAGTSGRDRIRDRIRGRRADLRALGVTIAIVAFAAQLPVLREHLFYYWDDSAAYFLPMWRMLGEQLRAGTLPLLQPDMWLGGDWAGEAQLGLFNPMVLGNALLVSYLPDLALAAIVVKTEFLVVLATGVYLLCREYGARPAASVVLAVALPFSGYTLYWDAQAWPASLIGFSLVPHMWWTARRFARGRLHPAAPLAVGFLAVTSGSPYGTLGVVIVVLAVGVERLWRRDLRSVLRLILVGLAIGCFAALVFFPLLGIRDVSYRTNSGVRNTMQLVPGLGQLLNLSTPTYVPPIDTYWNPPSTPMTYLSWFVLPLVPWFRWPVLAGLRDRAGVLVFGGAYLALALGPSDLWLFRWPARLIEYVYLPVCVLVAILLSAGLRTELSRGRLLASAGLLGGGAYLAWAATPQTARRHLVGVVVLALLVAAVLAVRRYRARLVAPVLVVGTLIVLGLQLLWFPGNVTTAPWHFPHDVASLRAQQASRADGNVFTVGVAYAVPVVNQRPDRAWREVLFSNVSHVAGLASLNAYSGMGNEPFQSALCMDPLGAVCAEAFERVFAVDGATGAPLADLLKLRTIVVLNGYLPGGGSVTEAPPGWAVTERGAYATAIRRQGALPYPDGRVSWTAPGLTVDADRRSGDVTEDVRYTGGGRLVLATIAWPGWHATVDGQPVPVRVGPAGLLEIDLPDRPDGASLHLSFWPTGLTAGIAGFAVGLLVAAGVCVWHGLDRRRRRASPGPIPTLR